MSLNMKISNHSELTVYRKVLFSVQTLPIRLEIFQCILIHTNGKLQINVNIQDSCHLIAELLTH